MNDHDYSKGRLIAHAGGALGQARYTNSREALENSRSHVSLIEFDVCRVADGLIVAHDGLEANYGLNGSFANHSIETFEKTLYKKKFHPMTMRDLISRLPESAANVILDIKSDSAEDYATILEEISTYCDAFDVRDKVIIQVYSSPDFACARRLGMNNFILALWKNFHDVRSEKCRRCVDFCFSQDPIGFRAISIRAIHFWKDDTEIGHDLMGYFFERSPMMFIHGQATEVEKACLDRGFGLFTHNPQALLPYLK